MFRKFNKIALLVCSIMLCTSVTTQAKGVVDETTDSVVISSEEISTTSTFIVSSNSISCNNISNNSVEIMGQEWGADLVTITFSDTIPNLDEDEQKEQMLIELTEPNVLDGTEGNEVCNSSKKTYMGYDAVTSVTSRQWHILNNEEYSWTDAETGFRMFGDRICIAIGQGYALPGDKVDVVMQNGSIIRCIVGDAKAIVDTDETMSYQKYDGSVIEMIVDYNYFSGTSQYPKELDGAIEKIVTLPNEF